MATYIVLMNWTEQGVGDAGDSPLIPLDDLRITALHLFIRPCLAEDPDVLASLLQLKMPGSLDERVSIRG